jgi:hypothetical protein
MYSEHASHSGPEKFSQFSILNELLGCNSHKGLVQVPNIKSNFNNMMY